MLYTLGISGRKYGISMPSSCRANDFSCRDLVYTAHQRRSETSAMKSSSTLPGNNDVSAARIGMGQDNQDEVRAGITGGWRRRDDLRRESILQSGFQPR